MKGCWRSARSHGLRLDLAERVFINQGCTLLDDAGIRLGEGVMVGPKVTFITVGHPVDPGERRQFLTGAPIDVARRGHRGRDRRCGRRAGGEPGGRPKGTVRRRWSLAGGGWVEVRLG